jgi:hypothetical protein
MRPESRLQGLLGQGVFEARGVLCVMQVSNEEGNELSASHFDSNALGLLRESSSLASLRPRSRSPRPAAVQRGPQSRCG